MRAIIIVLPRLCFRDKQIKKKTTPTTVGNCLIPSSCFDQFFFYHVSSPRFIIPRYNFNPIFVTISNKLSTSLFTNLILRTVGGYVDRHKIFFLSNHKISQEIFVYEKYNLMCSNCILFDWKTRKWKYIRGMSYHTLRVVFKNPDHYLRVKSK